jgi:AcrR family transcriptional regulator
MAALPRPSRREDIVTAATECFAVLGFDRTRTKDIAERSGMSEAAIYRHFRSLTDLAKEVHSANLADYVHRIQACTEDGTPEQKLRMIVRVTIERYRENKHSFMATLVQIPSFMPQLPAATPYPLQIIAPIIAEAQAAGAARAGSPKVLASMFLGAMLRPMVLAEVAELGPFDMLNDTRHDRVIEEFVIAAIFDHRNRSAQP